MNNEQKLSQLLKIANEYGWKDINNLSDNLKSNYFNLIPDNTLIFDDNHDVGVTYSINDIVLSFEPETTSFIQALYKASIEMNYPLMLRDDLFWIDGLAAWENLMMCWSLKRTYCSFNKEYKHEIRPDSEKLDWLFETFKHLINE